MMAAQLEEERLHRENLESIAAAQRALEIETAEKEFQQAMIRAQEDAARMQTEARRRIEEESSSLKAKLESESQQRKLEQETMNRILVTGGAGFRRSQASLGSWGVSNSRGVASSCGRGGVDCRSTRRRVTRN